MSKDVKVQRILIIRNEGGTQLGTDISLGYFREFIYNGGDGKHTPSVDAIVQDRAKKGRVECVPIKDIIFLDLPDGDFSDCGLRQENDFSKRL